MPEEKQALDEAGIDMQLIRSVADLVQCEDVFFAATGILDGTFLGGVDYTGSGAVICSLVIYGKTGPARHIESHHQWERLM